MQLVQVRLLVQRFPEVYDFYANVLGLTPQRGAREGSYEKLSFPAGDAAIALQTRADLESAVSLVEADRAAIVVRVESVDDYAHAIAQRGATLLAPPATRFGRIRVAYVRDPAGTLIELQTW